MGFRPCRTCGTGVAKAAVVCSHCGADRPARRNWVRGLLKLALLAGLLLLARHFGAFDLLPPDLLDTVVRALP